MSEGGDHTEDLAPEAKEWCRLVARILRRRTGDTGTILPHPKQSNSNESER